MSQAEARHLRALLEQGSALLARGQLRPAQECALEALALRPGHAEAKNLIGLVYYYERAYGLACDVFDGLARRNGDAVALRVNAGVAALRCQRTALALLHLRRAVDLDPGHRRAYAYLALLHLQGGDRSFAGAALREAGLSELARRSEDAATDLGALAEELSRELPKLPVPDFERRQQTGERFAEISEIDRAPTSTMEHARVPSAPQPELFVPDGEPAALSARATLTMATDRDTVAFDSVAPAVAIGPEIEVRDNRAYLRCGAWRADGFGRSPVVLREDQILLIQGALSLAAASRRSRGYRAEAFELDGGRMVVLDGEGVVVLEPPSGARLTLITLAADGSALCLREDHLSAFSAAVSWANGRLPRGRRLIRLAGRGSAVLCSRGGVGRAQVDEGTPAIVRASALLGWLGDVVVSPYGRSPRRPAAEIPALFYRCEGEGTLFVKTEAEEVTRDD